MARTPTSTFPTATNGHARDRLRAGSHRPPTAPIDAGYGATFTVGYPSSGLYTIDIAPTCSPTWAAP
jgi:hypothetical protein